MANLCQCTITILGARASECADAFTERLSPLHMFPDVPLTPSGDPLTWECATRWNPPRFLADFARENGVAILVSCCEESPSRGRGIWYPDGTSDGGMEQSPNLGDTDTTYAWAGEYLETHAAWVAAESPRVLPLTRGASRGNPRTPMSNVVNFPGAVRLVLREHNCVSNDPCALCGQRIDHEHRMSGGEL
jgi:hypothetical protein